MMDCLNVFCEASEQKVSREKTKMLVSSNVNLNRALKFSRRCGFTLTGDLGKYLGVPLLHKRSN